MSNLTLRLAELADLAALARIDRDAFYPGEHPFIESMYQHQRTESGLKNKLALWQSQFGKTPNERTFTVVDNSSGELILCARALVPCSEEDLQNLIQPSKLPSQFWDTEDNRAWAEHLSERYTQRRRDVFRKHNGQVFSITHMAVDPNHQREGAGSFFVRWVTDQADEAGLDCTVEAGLRAESFYRKHGFEAVETCRFPAPEGEERWRDKETQVYIWMIRRPQTSARIN